jgi:hypothetical protein
LTLNVYQSRRSNAESRAQLVAQTLKEFSGNADMQAAFYLLEYSDFVYDDSFHGSELERKIDHLLRHFSNLALAWQAGLLSKKDVLPVQYYVLRIMQNPEIRRYMEFLENWASVAGAAQHPYIVLGKLANELGSNSGGLRAQRSSL